MPQPLYPYPFGFPKPSAPTAVQPPAPVQPPPVKFKSLEEHLEPYLLPGTKPTQSPDGIGHDKFRDELRHKSGPASAVAAASLPYAAEYMGKTSPRKVLEQRVYGGDTQNQLNQANKYNKSNKLPKLEIDNPTDLYGNLEGGSFMLPNRGHGVAMINPSNFFSNQDPEATDTIKKNIINGFQPIKPGQLPTSRSSPNTLLNSQKSPFDTGFDATTRAFANDVNIPEATKQVIFNKGPQFQKLSPETAVGMGKRIADLSKFHPAGEDAGGDPYVRTDINKKVVDPASPNNAEYNQFTDEAVGQLMNHEVGGHGIYDLKDLDTILNESSGIKNRVSAMLNVPANKMTNKAVPVWKKDLPLPKVITNNVPQKYIPQIPASTPVGSEPPMAAYQATPGEMMNGLIGLQRTKYLNEGQRWTNPDDFKNYMQGIMNSGDVEKSMQGISPDGKRFIRSLVPLAPEERQKVIDRASFIMPGIVQNQYSNQNQKTAETKPMNTYFYNGFIKRAQEYGIPPVKAAELYKLAANPGEADLNDSIATMRTKPAVGKSLPKPLPKPNPLTVKPTPSADDLAARAASKTPVTPLQAETARLMRANNK